MNMMNNTAIIVKFWFNQCNSDYRLSRNLISIEFLNASSNQKSIKQLLSGLFSVHELHPVNFIQLLKKEDLIESEINAQILIHNGFVVQVENTLSIIFTCYQVTDRMVESLNSISFTTATV